MAKSTDKTEMDLPAALARIGALEEQLAAADRDRGELVDTLREQRTERRGARLSPELVPVLCELFRLTHDARYRTAAEQQGEELLAALTGPARG